MSPGTEKTLIYPSGLKPAKVTIEVSIDETNPRTSGTAPTIPQEA